jgi:hypothetical protein
MVSFEERNFFSEWLVAVGSWLIHLLSRRPLPCIFDAGLPFRGGKTVQSVELEKGKNKFKI